MEELLQTIGTLIEYGIAFATLALVAFGFMTDVIRSGKSSDREITREREITDRAMVQVDRLTEALSELSDAWEKRNDIEDALRRDREGR